MNGTIAAAALAAGLAAAGVGGATAQERPPPPRPQSALALDMESADWETSARAVGEALRIRAAERGPALRRALIGALEAQGMPDAPRAPSYEAGADYVDALLDAVLEMRDPASIPALVRSPTFGAPVATALADFGPRALPAALEAATSPDSREFLVSSALMTLRIMVEEWGGPAALSPERRAELAAAAALYLNGPGEAYAELTADSGWRVGIVVRRAMGLAAVLGDSGLRSRLEEIAADASVAEALGVTSDGSAARTQAEAAALLAGTPPLPRPKRW